MKLDESLIHRCENPDCRTTKRDIAIQKSEVIKAAMKAVDMSKVTAWYVAVDTEMDYEFWPAALVGPFTTERDAEAAEADLEGSLTAIVLAVLMPGFPA